MTANVAIVSIEEEMKKSYLEYAMSVIVGRALPDVRDGLKPVQRRILYAMYEMGLEPTKPYRKSARIVGEVLGKYHPHGDMAVYDAMVRMAQDFTLRYPLIDGQGNFGSVDGDPPAAMRYTEARLTPIAMEMLADIDKETVDFVPNFDGSMEEPIVLPARIPNLLINGASGIAVGMATNIPPHNLTETIRACLALLENPGMGIEDLMKILPGPDFPTGGIICGREGIESAYRTGKGIIQVRGKVRVERQGERQALVITELPYQVNKASLVQRIAELAQTKKVEGIVEVRDESDREGLRVVIELKRDEDPQRVLAHLYKFTPLQSSFGIILLALVGGQPMVLNLKQMLELFLEHRKEVVSRRSRYELQQAERRAHILEGFLKALEVIEEIIALIKASETPQEAKEGLISRFGFTEVQAQAILEMRLQRLTGLERDKIAEEFEDLSKRISKLREILTYEEKLKEVVAEELREVMERYGDRRRTEIQDQPGVIEFEDLVPEEEVVITITQSGYIKRTAAEQYRRQGRGGRGRLGISLRDGDFVRQVFIANTTDNLLFFTDKGKAYGLKVHEIPDLPPSSRGKAISGLLRLDPDERVTAVVPVKDFTEGEVLLVTRKGMVKKTALEEFRNARQSGIIAMLLREDDRIVGAEVLKDEQEVLIGTKLGNAILIPSAEIRTMGRNAQGVKGIKVKEGDEVVAMIGVKGEGFVLFVSEKGYGKRVKVEEFRAQKRGGQGVLAMKVTSKSGPVVGMLFLEGDEDVILGSSEGLILRIRAKKIPLQGRYSTGARLMKVREGQQVMGIAAFKD